MRGNCKFYLQRSYINPSIIFYCNSMSAKTFKLIFYFDVVLHCTVEIAIQSLYLTTMQTQWSMNRALHRFVGHSSGGRNRINLAMMSLIKCKTKLPNKRLRLYCIAKTKCLYLSLINFIRGTIIHSNILFIHIKVCSLISYLSNVVLHYVGHRSGGKKNTNLTNIGM